MFIEPLYRQSDIKSIVFANKIRQTLYFRKKSEPGYVYFAQLKAGFFELPAPGILVWRQGMECAIIFFMQASCFGSGEVLCG